ncbi:hypothetical protein AQS8620_00916 [Aquimixticola soesokkakensis]|uniref:Lysozyme inhibitor LprI-like N-terminal domain-containing protein n=1 Tax=Aquimixticola soesokkakensis TaxID=1519096 RepID=A0A1Y5S0A2_9RHOB|nr:lysozyme inhibitor LprI family protein [Aquimixticola soesokkakensis]SLN29815.1 hypothetical protein AQS8620_00916 [Aquimixticola soesokkakensis]
MRYRGVFAVVFTLLADGAAAQEVDCSDPDTQMELTFCAQQDWQAADAALNDMYKRAMVVLSQIDESEGADQPYAMTYLRDAQRAWITFRDNACAAEGYRAHGGSMEPMLIYGCRARLTEQRVQDLHLLTQTY